MGTKCSPETTTPAERLGRQRPGQRQRGANGVRKLRVRCGISEIVVSAGKSRGVLDRPGRFDVPLNAGA